MVSLPRRIERLLSISKVSTCGGYNETSICRSAVKQMQEKIELDPMGLHIVLVDNLGYIDKPSASHDSNKKTYRQYIKIIDLFVPYEECAALGLYNKDPSNRLSREDETLWEELHESREAVAETLTKPNEQDLIRLTNCYAEAMEIAIDDARHKRLTTIGSKRIRSGRVWNQQSRADLLRRAQFKDYHQSDIETLIESDVSDEVERVTGQSLYSNKRLTEHIVKLDLSRKDTIIALAEYSRSVNEKMLEMWEESEYNVEGAEPPLAKSFGGYILCDGQPATQFSVLKAEDGGSTDPKYQNVHCRFGPFHTLMKLQNASGQMFSEIFDIVFGTYRVTEARIKYIRAPSDNRQREAEDPEMAQALYASAADFYAEYYEEYPSVQQLHEFMLERARLYPVCMMLVIYTRFVEIQKIMKLSERAGTRGDIDMFHSALRLALPLFAMTHKTDYMRLICDELVKSKCISPAEEVIHKNFLFTQVDSTGYAVHSDLFVELAIRWSRSHTGKKVFRNLDAKLEQSVYTNTVVREHDGNIIERLRSGRDEVKNNRSKTHLILTQSSPVTKMYNYFRECQFFQATEPPIIGYDEDTGSPVYAEEGSNSLPKGREMNPNVLAVTATGASRVKKYMEVNNLETQYKVSRSEEDVSLRSEFVSAADILKALNARVDKKTSLDYGRLNEFTISELTEEIEDIIVTLPELRKTGMKKNDYVLKLIELRKLYFELDIGAKEHIAERTKLEFEAEQQPGMTADDILQLEIYKLSEEVLSNERYSKPHGPRL
jgi:hypothetical protein